MSAGEFDVDLDEANARLLPMTAADRLRWGADQFGPAMVLLSSMQQSASILMHLFHRLALDNEILFVDTGFHFHQTLQLRDEFLLRYRLRIVTLYPLETPSEQEEKYGRKLHLSVDGQPECCRLRKEVPFLEFMRRRHRRVVVSGLRVGEGGRRAQVAPLMRDPRINGYTLHPICDWTKSQVTEYLARYQPPVHPLHELNYPSIGCVCCTTPVQPGEDARAGRWRHLRQAGQGPQYCGINFTDGSGI